MEGRGLSSTLYYFPKLCSVGPPGDWDESLSRLAAPKVVNPNFIPDKPSVYWLDYLVDPTPHRIRNPAELESYYRKFETPRLQRLSKPKLTLPSGNLELLPTKPSSGTGIPLSALRYVPTERIRQLAEPRATSSLNVRVTRSCSNHWPGKIRTSGGNPLGEMNKDETTGVRKNEKRCNISFFKNDFQKHFSSLVAIPYQLGYQYTVSVSIICWGGPQEDFWYNDITTTWIKAGVVSIFAIGNTGPSCSTAPFTVVGPTPITKLVQPEIAAPRPINFSAVASFDTLRNHPDV
ncbi:unnamed protein product [Allacma fusca]|uniref:Peptidase S8/S53 domain-containing protein n=1 Tax=Allacma fusca TaxID=39272 RepID=A0A8J2J5Q2_9HEXA|nr:unnamed protein product [Allacma fusca]